MAKDAWTSFGEALYGFRLRQGLQQIAVARSAGVSKGYYSSFENSKRRPPPVTTIHRIALVLDLSNAELADLQALGEYERHGCAAPLAVLRLLARLRQGGYACPRNVLVAIEAALSDQGDLGRVYRMSEIQRAFSANGSRTRRVSA